MDFVHNEVNKFYYSQFIVTVCHMQTQNEKSIKFAQTFAAYIMRKI